MNQRSTDVHILGKFVVAAAATVSLTGMAAAADLIAPAPPAVVSPAVVTDWTGLYVGVHGGFASGNSDHVGVGVTTGDFPMSGGFLGAQAGFNFNLSDAFVLGIEGDVSWANITGSQTTFPEIHDTIDWMGSIRGRLGYDVGGVLPYLTAGVAFANSTRTSQIGALTQTLVHTGWTAGVGAEFKLADNVSANVEYRYSDFGQQTYTALPGPPDVSLTNHSIRAGLNFHFQ
jgi:outer membrane autotransporter protein